MVRLVLGVGDAKLGHALPTATLFKSVDEQVLGFCDQIADNGGAHEI